MELSEILLVEDNPGDVLLMQKAFERCRIINRIHLARDGEAALRFLRNEAPFEAAPCPHLILLDLNLPKLDGREVLREIKSDPVLKVIPVVVLTSSDAESDVLRSYQLHANSFLTKPPTISGLQEVLMNLYNYWFAIVRLPPAPDVTAADAPVPAPSAKGPLR